MVEFRKIGPDELYKIRQIAFVTWPHTFGEVIPKEQIDYMLELIYNEKSLKKQMLEKKHNFLLAERSSEALGFTSYELDFHSEHQLMIHKLYLLPSTQGLGIGTNLLDYLSEIALLNGNPQLRLKVFVKNAKAVGFYENYGFQNVGTETTELGNGYSVLDNVMVKKLR